MTKVTDRPSSKTQTILTTLTSVGRSSDQLNLKKDIHTIVSLITSGVIDQTKDDVVTILRNLATELDKKQRDMNIAKTAFASSGILGTGLAIGGVIAAPFTLGASLGLTVAGVAVGVTSGLGGLATAIADQIVNGNTMKEAEAAIARYMEKVNELIDMINFFYTATTDEEDFDSSEILQEELDLVPTSKDKKNLEIILRGLRTGIDASGSAVHVGVTIGAVSSNAAAAAGRSAFSVAGNGLKMVRLGGAVLSVLTIPLDLHVIVTNSIKLHNNTPSEVAEQIRGMAKTLEQHQLLDSDDEDAIY